MKVFKFRNGTTYSVENTSTLHSILLKVNSFAEIDGLKENFTEENLKNAELTEDEKVEKGSFLVPVKITVHAEDGVIAVTLTSREKTTVELQSEQIDELQTAVTDLMMGEF